MFYRLKRRIQLRPMIQKEAEEFGCEETEEGGNCQEAEEGCYSEES